MTSSANTKAPARQTVPASFRLEASAHAKLLERAKEAGVSTRAWLESAVLENQTRIVARQKPHPDLRPLLFQVSRAGNNINQIAHRLNALHLSGKLGADDVSRAFEALEGVTELLQEALTRAR